MSEFILKPGDKPSLAWTPQGDGEKKHGIKLNRSPDGYQPDFVEAEINAAGDDWLKRMFVGFDPMPPLDMNARYIFWYAQQALSRAYYLGEDLGEAKIQLLCKGDLNTGDSVDFQFGLKGRVVGKRQWVYETVGIVEVFLADFGKMWNSLTTAQRFDEE